MINRETLKYVTFSIFTQTVTYRNILSDKLSRFWNKKIEVEYSKINTTIIILKSSLTFNVFKKHVLHESTIILRGKYYKTVRL